MFSNRRQPTKNCPIRVNLRSSVAKNKIGHKFSRMHADKDYHVFKSAIADKEMPYPC